MLYVNHLIGFGATTDDAVTYRYYRWGSVTGATPQFAEVQLTIGGTDQIPTMTAATTSGVTMSGDSTFSAGQEPWRAGADNGTTSLFGSNGVSGAGFLKVDFGAGNAKAITAYTVQAVTGGSFNPVSWTFAGSNDDSAYTTLDTQSGLSWTSAEVKTFSAWTP